MAIGGLADINFHFFDLGFSLWHIQEKYITRKPLPLEHISNILKPFSHQVWIVLLMTLTIFSLLFLTIHKMYSASEPFRNLNLARREESTCVFFLYSFTKLTEADVLPWFSTWSAGRLATLLYYIMAWLMIQFYSCNLKTYMATIQYEAPPADRSDLIKQQSTVYIPNENVKQRCVELCLCWALIKLVIHLNCQVFATYFFAFSLEYLEFNGLQHSIRYDLAKLAKKTNGFFNYKAEGIVPSRAAEVVPKNNV